MILYWVTTIFIFCYGILFLHLGIAVLVIKKKTVIHYISAALLGDFGAMCVAGGVYCYANRNGIADNVAVFVPMVLLAPIGSAFAIDCFGAGQSARRLTLFLRAGTAAVLLAGMALILAGSPWRYIFAIAYGWLAVSFSAVLAFEARELKPVRAMPRGLRAFFYLICIDVSLVILMFVAQLLDFYDGLYLLWMTLIVSMFGTTLIAFRSPCTYRLISSQATRIRYERSRLGSVSVDERIATMTRIMREEELYRDPDLTLEELAERLGVSAPQLSELLNSHVGTTFRAYLNGLRIERAKGALLEDGASTILDIAFESGFNSKSAFNAAFRNATGLTPSEYRKGR